MVNDLKTTIINLYGGPGAGKSTSAAYLYYLLKIRGVNTELVREYIKDWVWENRTIQHYDQWYFLGKQIRKETLLYGKVQVVITDSPVLMNAYYSTLLCSKEIASNTKDASLAFYNQSEKDGHKHIHVLLKRNHEYLAEGRYQSESEAKQIDVGIENLLNILNIKYLTVNSDEDSLKKLLLEII